MRKPLLSALAAAALLSNFIVGADAMPAPRLMGQDENANVQLVRDGCGINRHFSPRFRRCVWNWRRY